MKSGLSSRENDDLFFERYRAEKEKAKETEPQLVECSCGKKLWRYAANVDIKCEECERVKK